MNRRSFISCIAGLFAAKAAAPLAPLALTEPVSLLPYRPKPSMCAITYPEGMGLRSAWDIEPADWLVFNAWASYLSSQAEQEMAIRRMIGGNGQEFTS